MHPCPGWVCLGAGVVYCFLSINFIYLIFCHHFTPIQMVYNLTTLTGAGNEVGAMLSVSVISGALLAISANMLGIQGKRRKREVGDRFPVNQLVLEAFDRHVVKVGFLLLVL